MTNQSTIDKLIEMRLSCMADSFRNQLNDPEFNEVPFEDRFGMIVDIEYNNRKSNRLKRLIKNQNKEIFLNFYTEDVKNHLPSFVLSMNLKNGMINLEVQTVHWQMLY